MHCILSGRFAKVIRRGLAALCVIFLVASILIFRPADSPNARAISMSLSELREPYQSVETSYFLDGGSVGIRIVDAGGREARFCVRADLGDGKQRYERLYHGALHYSDAAATEVAKPTETIMRLLEIMRSADGVDHERDFAVASVSGRWRDFAVMIWRKFGSRVY
jgi:hypothetical protein